jgi:hypothetical protein
MQGDEISWFRIRHEFLEKKIYRRPQSWGGGFMIRESGKNTNS